MSLHGRIICIPELHVSASGHLNFGSFESLPLPHTPLHSFCVILEFTTWNEDVLVQGRKEHVHPMFGSLFACNIGSCKCAIQRGSRRDLLNIFPKFPIFRWLEILGLINAWLPLDPNIMFHDSWDLDST